MAGHTVVHHTAFVVDAVDGVAELAGVVHVAVAVVVADTAVVHRGGGPQTVVELQVEEVHVPQELGQIVVAGVAAAVVGVEVARVVAQVAAVHVVHLEVRGVVGRALDLGAVLEGRDLGGVLLRGLLPALLQVFLILLAGGGVALERLGNLHPAQRGRKQPGRQGAPRDGFVRAARLDRRVGHDPSL